jgi:hypothetical protein
VVSVERKDIVAHLVSVMYEEYSRKLDREIKRIVGKKPCDADYDFKKHFRRLWFTFDSMLAADHAGERAKSLQTPQKKIWVGIVVNGS